MTSVIVLSIMLPLLFASLGMLATLMLESTTSEYLDSTKEHEHRFWRFDAHFIMRNFGIYKIKLNIIRFFYGMLLLIGCNILILLIFLPIVDLLLWLLQINYSTTKTVGKLLFNKLKHLEQR